MRRPARVMQIMSAVAVAALIVASSACTDNGDDSAATRPSPTTAATGTSAPDVDALGDGVHQVQVDAADLLGGKVTLDGVQVMEGMEAVLAYLADTDGAQLEGAQVYVRNGIATPTEFPVDAAGSFSVILADACCEPVEVGWSGLADAVNSDFEALWGNNPPFEATIEAAEVVAVEQIHIP